MGESLHQDTRPIKLNELGLSMEEMEKFNALRDLTWHLEWTSGVGAGWRMREGGTAATSRGVWEAISR